MIWLVLFACGTSEPVFRDQAASPASEVDVDPVLGRLRAKRLELTRHGECRMGCRHIDREEVEEILRVGEVNASRTRHDGECSSYAVEGTTHDEQRVRIVFADCPLETRVVTAIDLGEDWPCDCQ